ncbi:uncharacterized protein [Panulirus ornatus]
MQATTQFIADRNPEKFASLLKLYPEALKIKESQKKKKKGESLQELDKWYQEELGQVANSRKPPNITRDELVRLMDWKLSRGKFRPRLIELAGSNSNESVQNASMQGIELAKKSKIGDAVKALVILKGVGPATASGILAACVPEKCCFFADEVAKAIPSLSSLKYTSVEYEVLNSEMADCAQLLNSLAKQGDEKENGNETWTPHKVELAVWTHSILHQNKPELLSNLNEKRSCTEEEEQVSKAKKQKK